MPPTDSEQDRMNPEFISSRINLYFDLNMLNFKQKGRFFVLFYYIAVNPYYAKAYRRTKIRVCVLKVKFKYQNLE